MSEHHPGRWVVATPDELKALCAIQAESSMVIGTAAQQYGAWIAFDDMLEQALAKTQALIFGMHAQACHVGNAIAKCEEYVAKELGIIA